MSKLHVTRRGCQGRREIYIEHRLLRGRPRREVVGYIGEDWCPNDRGRMVYGYYWVDKREGFGRTFCRLRDALADFEKERKGTA